MPNVTACARTPAALMHYVGQYYHKNDQKKSLHLWFLLFIIYITYYKALKQKIRKSLLIVEF